MLVYAPGVAATTCHSLGSVNHNRCLDFARSPKVFHMKLVLLKIKIEFF